MFLIGPPPALQAEIEAATQLGGRLTLLGRSAEAFEVYRRLFERMLSAQPEGHRFHKGLPLHNMGFARLRDGLNIEAARWTSMAFIEDSLSRAEELPLIADELSRPAAQNLRLLGVPESALLELARSIRRFVGGAGLAQDPTEIFVEQHLEQRLAGWLRAGAARLRVRVFVSSPGELRPERRLIAEICRELTLTLPANVEALLWEGGGPLNPEVPPFPPEVTGLGAQAVIDDHVWRRLGGYDVYVGMLWRRMGTPTGTWRSGTEAEFRFADARRAASGTPATLLFYVKRPKPGVVVDADVSDFVSELRGLGLVIPFRSREELRRMAFSHLATIIHERLGSQ